MLNYVLNYKKLNIKTEKDNTQWSHNNVDALTFKKIIKFIKY